MGSTKKIAAVVVPYELGRLRHGTGCGPDRLLEVGAETSLASNGASVHTHVVEIHPRYLYLNGHTIAPPSPGINGCQRLVSQGTFAVNRQTPVVC
jgi:hypothetical protein